MDIPPIPDANHPHPLVWVASAVCGLLVLGAGLLPGFSVRIEGYIGAGEARRGFDFERTFSLLAYAHPRYLAVVAAALLALAAAAWGWRTRDGWRPLAAILAASVVGLSLMAAEFFTESASGGVFLHTAVEEVRDIARNSAAGRNPEFDFVGAYAAAPAVGWHLTQIALGGLLVVSGASLGRRVRTIGWWAIVTAAVAAIVLLSAIPAPDCGDSGSMQHDPDTNPIGLLAVYLALACSAVGLGALIGRRWIEGALSVLIGFGVAVMSALVLVAMDCSFY